ncbi:hypothetical protein ERE07_02040 [Allopusillimonas ginsengisoli]|nr:hypothetical protein ERE07_02040 [Allopusillimonas ginsengisoli]
MNIANWLHSRALLAPEAPALCSGTSLWATYRQFAVRANALAAHLQSDYPEGCQIAGVDTDAFRALMARANGLAAPRLVAPMSHGAGLYNFAFVLFGARHVVPVSRGFDSREILALAESKRSIHWVRASRKSMARAKAP